jgi:ribosome-associated protein
MPSTSNKTGSETLHAGQPRPLQGGPSTILDEPAGPGSENHGVYGQTAPVSSSGLALLIADAADRKKASDIVVLDLRGISTFTEFYVICSGSSEPQLKAIVEEVQDVLRKEVQVRARRVDGFPYSQWVVADFGDVILHVFHESKRHHYALEDLWSDAPRLNVPEKAPPSSEVSP